jgi:hypothetical protein
LNKGVVENHDNEAYGILKFLFRADRSRWRGIKDGKEILNTFEKYSSRMFFNMEDEKMEKKSGRREEEVGACNEKEGWNGRGWETTGWALTTD